MDSTIINDINSNAKQKFSPIRILENSKVKSALPVIGFIVICILFGCMTEGRLFMGSNIKLLLSQSYMLLISTSGVFLIMTMGGLDFSQGSMLGGIFNSRMLSFTIQYFTCNFGWYCDRWNYWIN